MSTRRMRTWAALAACLLSAVPASSCNLIAGVPGEAEGGRGGFGGAPSTCNVDTDCDDHEVCTTDTCSDSKACVHSKAADGPAPDSEQTLGDCKTVMCADGVAKSQNDDDDIDDDGEDCTTDACSNGVAHNTPRPVSTPCEVMGSVGRCSTQGVCEAICTSAADCVPPNPCQTGECDTLQGICNFPHVSDGTPTPGVPPVIGDCKVQVCTGGEDTGLPDDSDVPLTATDCDQELCTNGVPSNPGLPIQTLCSTYNGNLPGFCDGNGTCQECAADTDCPGVIDDCKHPACNATTFKCFQQNTPAMTPTVNNPPQVAGDCQTKVCDGNGGTTNVYASSDPAPDGNQCTTDACTAPNTTIHPNAPNGMACGAGGMLACTNGLCAGCTLSTQCQPASCNGTVLTKAQTCNTGNNTCVAPALPTQDCAPYLCQTAGSGSCTTSCVNDAGCSQGGIGNWCNAGSCVPKHPTPSPCTAGSQCQSTFCVDGVCCNTLCTGTCQACSAAKKGSGMDGQCGAIANGTDPDGDCPDDGVASCDRDGMCNGAGACRLYAAGSICTAACAGGMLTINFCNGAGSCVAGSPVPCPGNLQCQNGTTCEIGCGSANPSGDAKCVSGHYCDGVGAGACQPKKVAGAMCGRPEECTSGSCSGMLCD